MKIRYVAVAAAAALIALPGAAMAKPGNGHGKGHGAAEQRDYRTPYRTSQGNWNGRACPPGLAKKNARCLPPGQYKRGDRVPDGWTRYYTRYDALPSYYRSRYAANPGYRYVYRDDRVYVIDALTRAIVNVLVR